MSHGRSDVGSWELPGPAGYLKTATVCDVNVSIRRDKHSFGLPECRYTPCVLRGYIPSRDHEIGSEAADRVVVGGDGIEPPTSSMSTTRSSQLS